MLKHNNQKAFQPKTLMRDHYQYSRKSQEAMGKTGT